MTEVVEQREVAAETWDALEQRDPLSTRNLRRR